MGATPPPLTSQEWQWLRGRHVTAEDLVHFPLTQPRPTGRIWSFDLGVVHTGPAPVFAEPQVCRVQLADTVVEFVGHIGTQKLDSLWRWLKRGVECVHRSDRGGFMQALRFTQWQHWSHHDTDKLSALGCATTWLRLNFPAGVDDASRTTP
eukprot:962580-Amphidinium_carterae.1